MSQSETESGLRLEYGLLPLHPRMPNVWAFKFALAFIAPLTPVLVPLMIYVGAPRSMAWISAVALGLLFGWRYSRRYCARYSASFLVDGVLIRRGVWWRAEIFVPRARIQHTEVNQGPLDRRWGMASVGLHTAGTRLEHITLPGLPRDVAEQLRDGLLDRRAHADGA